MENNDKEHINTTTIRLVDFHTTHPSNDPVSNMELAYYKTVFTQHDTPAPKNCIHTASYSDTHPWKEAHNDDLDKLDGLQADEWLTAIDVPQGVKVIPITMMSFYSQDGEGRLRKESEMFLQGDKMSPDVH